MSASDDVSGLYDGPDDTYVEKWEVAVRNDIRNTNREIVKLRDRVVALEIMLDSILKEKGQ